MQTNDFLLYNEVVYRIHACRTMEEFPTILLTQVKLLIPYAYGSFIPIHTDPKTQEVTHGEPCCYPPSFVQAEERWLQAIHRGYSLWLSYAPEAVVARDSELLSGDSRFDAPSYRQIYLDYHIYDCLQMNVALAGRNMGRLALYRTRAEGAFTDQELRPAWPAWPGCTVANSAGRTAFFPRWGKTQFARAHCHLQPDPAGGGDPGTHPPRLQQRGDSGQTGDLPQHPAQALAEPLPEVRRVLPVGPAEAAGITEPNKKRAAARKPNVSSQPPFMGTAFKRQRPGPSRKRSPWPEWPRQR